MPPKQQSTVYPDCLSINYLPCAHQYRLNARQLCCHLLPQSGVVPKCLRIDTTHDAAGIVDQGIKLLIGPDVQLAESAKELRQVLDRRVSKHLRLAVFVAGESFRQVRHELGDAAQMNFRTGVQMNCVVRSQRGARRAGAM